MPEYLAPGVFVEEVSYRSKSIEGVGTTTTGFVGPTRYGPVEIEPEVITNLTEFERVYGGGRQLAFSDAGSLHNYTWHGVRSFFEEGGKRLYVARVFRPSADPKNEGYVSPPDDIAKDSAALNSGEYATDGHARLWLTASTRAVSATDRAVQALGTGVQALSNAVDAASAASDFEAQKPVASQNDASPFTLAGNVVTVLGVGAPPGSETGVAKLAVQAKTLADAAKAAFATSTIDLTEFNNAADDFRSAATDASAAAGSLAVATVITPALNDAKAKYVTAVTELENTGAAAAAIAGHAKASTELKNLATSLQKSSTNVPAPDGTAWRAFDAARTETGKATSANAPVAADAARSADAQKDAVKLAAAAIAAKAAADNVTDADLKTKLDALSVQVKKFADAAGKAFRAALYGAYPRAYALNIILAGKRNALLEKLAALQQKTAQTVSSVNGGPRPPADMSGAVLLRARFPGAAGNSSISIFALLGQNILVADSADASKSVVRGILPGDLARIGLRDGAPADAAANKVYLAYPSADGKDWYFSTDGKATNAAYWLNNVAGTKLDPLVHEVCIVTSRVDVTHANGNAESWAGLAFQPGHTRNGAADALTDKFKPAPNNGNDARTLPFVVLTDKSVSSGCDVFRVLLERKTDDSTAKSDWPISATHQLAGGNDGARPGAAEYAGHGDGPDDPKTGLKALEDVEDISIVAAPGAMFGYMNGYKSDAQQIVNSLIGHAENMKYRIAVLESGDGQSIGDVREMRARYDSKYAALYYPWVRVLDPVTRDEIHLPPGGFVAGIYARNDVDRAVYKAPANEVVRGAIGFQTLLNKAQQEVLNPEGVNCFRFFEGRGFRLWGARTISSDPEWKYVNVRRYFAYLERSIDRGTQWAVFEPNGEALWANVRETISDFLYNEWKNGALLGTDPKSAYFVRCDRSTMTQNDLDNGRLVCKIGVAALKPAEFVIFQIGQWTGDRKA